MAYGTAIPGITENGKDIARNGTIADECLIESWHNCQSRDKITKDTEGQVSNRRKVLLALVRLVLLSADILL